VSGCVGGRPGIYGAQNSFLIGRGTGRGDADGRGGEGNGVRER
jgi:hypothetical protein